VRGSPVILLILAALALAVAAAVVATIVVRRRRLRRRPLPPTGVPRHALVLVHGIMGFEAVPVWRARYFRGIARHLEERGLVVREPRLPPFGSVPERAARLAEFIHALPDDRVNVIAHSMGGLDARFAIARHELAPRIASLTTIGTPHRGTPIAEWKRLAPAALLRRLGALEWLTPEAMVKFNEEILDDPRVTYACVVGRVDGGLAETSPLLVPSHMWLRRRAGTSDGLVPSASQKWGTLLFEVPADHWAQIGWRLGYDTRALYDEIVAALVARGL
jgi:triacylglycerol lipase